MAATNSSTRMDTETKRQAEQLLTPSFDELRSQICDAVAAFYRRDSYLLLADAHERSMTFRLGIYLQALFPLWDVDCEYNRNGGNIKRIPGQNTVFPDVIIHKRGTGDNLLVIEAKTANWVKRNPASENDDIDKIQEYIQQPDLQYRFGLFWEIKKNVETACAGLKWCTSENNLPVWRDNQGKNIPKPVFPE